MKFNSPSLQKIYQNSPPLWKGFFYGLLAALVLSIFLSWIQDQDLKTVLVAQKDIPAKTEISEAMLEYRKIPARYLPHSLVQPEHKNLIIGKMTRFAFSSGDVLRWQDFMNESSAAEQLSNEISSGYRAFSLPLDKAESMKAWLRPGDLIDIIGSFHQEHSRQVTRTLFQNVSILKTKPQLVFLLTPEQVELLTFAQRTGNLSISLRNRADHALLTPLPEHEFQKFLGSESLPHATGAKGKGPQVLSLHRKGKTS